VYHTKPVTTAKDMALEMITDKLPGTAAPAHSAWPIVSATPISERNKASRAVARRNGIKTQPNKPPKTAIDKSAVTQPGRLAITA
jgi:hypothetical protein